RLEAFAAQIAKEERYDSSDRYATVRKNLEPPYEPAGYNGDALRSLDTFYEWPAAKRQGDIDAVVKSSAEPGAKLAKLQGIAVEAQRQILAVVREVGAEKQGDARPTEQSSSQSSSKEKSHSSFHARKIVARAEGSSSSSASSQSSSSSETVEYTGT